MDRYKYLALFPVPKPYRSEIEALADRVAQHTGLTPPHRKLCPHMTFHRPFSGISEEAALCLTQSVALQCRPTRVTVNHIWHFGKHYIVLPVQTTLANAYFWVRFTEIFSQLPDYEHGLYDFDNTLHLTLAEKTTPVFDRAWPRIREIYVREMNIPMEKVSLYRKPEESGVGEWEMLAEFPLSG